MASDQRSHKLPVHEVEHLEVFRALPQDAWVVDLSEGVPVCIFASRKDRELVETSLLADESVGVDSFVESVCHTVQRLEKKIGPVISTTGNNRNKSYELSFSPIRVRMTDGPQTLVLITGKIKASEHDEEIAELVELRRAKENLAEALRFLSTETRNQLMPMQTIVSKTSKEVDDRDMEELASSTGAIDSIVRKVLLLSAMHSTDATLLKKRLRRMNCVFSLRTLFDRCTANALQMLGSRHEGKINMATGASVSFKPNIEVSSKAATAVGSSALRVKGNRPYTIQIITNVLSNAIQFTDEGTVTFTAELDVDTCPSDEDDDSDVSSATTSRSTSRRSSATSRPGTASSRNSIHSVASLTSPIMATQNPIAKLGLNSAMSAEAQARVIPWWQHTEAGGETGPPLLLRVTVRDTGCGMTPEDCAEVASSFGLARSRRSAVFNGTGLGLPMAKKMADLLGGSLNVASELHKGTTVIVTVPLRASPPEKKSPVVLRRTLGMSTHQTGNGSADAGAELPWLQEALTTTMTITPATGADVLVVEDHPMTRTLYRHRAEKVGLRVVVVSSGPAALSLVSSGKRFGVIVLDLYMDEMMGDEVCRAMRARNYDGIIVCCAEKAFSPEERGPFLQANGFDDMVSKSASPSSFDLLSKLARLKKIACLRLPKGLTVKQRLTHEDPELPASPGGRIDSATKTAQLGIATSRGGGAATGSPTGSGTASPDRWRFRTGRRGTV